MYNAELIKDLLIEQFGFLRHQGFQFLSFDFNDKIMWPYWKIRFQSDVCLLMIYSDEDQVGILFYPLDATSEQRYEILTFVYYISAGKKFIGYYKGNTSNWQHDISSWKNQLEWIAKILEDYLDEIMKIMKDLPQHRDGLEKLGKEYGIKIDEDFKKTYPRKTDP